MRKNLDLGSHLRETCPANKPLEKNYAKIPFRGTITGKPRRIIKKEANRRARRWLNNWRNWDE